MTLDVVRRIALTALVAPRSGAHLAGFMARFAVISISDIGIFGEAGGVAGVVIHLHEAFHAFKALFIGWPETFQARGVAADAHVVVLIFKESDGLAIGNADIALGLGLSKVHLAKA